MWPGLLTLDWCSTGIAVTWGVNHWTEDLPLCLSSSLYIWLYNKNKINLFYKKSKIWDHPRWDFLGVLWTQILATGEKYMNTWSSFGVLHQYREYSLAGTVAGNTMPSRPEEDVMYLLWGWKEQVGPLSQPSFAKVSELVEAVRWTLSTNNPWKDFLNPVWMNQQLLRTIKITQVTPLEQSSPHQQSMRNEQMDVSISGCWYSLTARISPSSSYSEKL